MKVIGVLGALVLTAMALACLSLGVAIAQDLYSTGVGLTGGSNSYDQHFVWVVGPFSLAGPSAWLFVGVAAVIGVLLLFAAVKVLRILVLSRSS